MKKKSILVLVLIIVLQVFMLAVTSVKKQEFHIDEIYSYILSNSYDAPKISYDEDMWGKAVHGSDFNKFVTVQPDEKFAYDKVYYNNSIDCHPPLFYWCLHTVCSFFPNVFTKWTGILLNFIFFILSNILLYLVSKELIKSEKLRFLPVILYGFSIYAVDTAIFIRMYMLLTLLAILFVYLNIYIIKYGLSTKRLALLMITLYLGAMTQYYFIVFASWGCGMFAVYLLCKKRIKEMLQYGICSCISIVAMLISYPYAITQATGSSTNNIGNEVVRNLFNIKLWIIQTIHLSVSFLRSLSFHYVISIAICVAVFIVLIYLVARALKKHSKIHIEFEYVWLALAAALTFLSITFIGGDYVYMRYIYHIIPFVFILIVVVFEMLCENHNRFQTHALIIVIAFSIFNAAMNVILDNSAYLFEQTAIQTRELEKYKDNNLVVVNLSDSKSTTIPTGNFTRISKFSNVYMDTFNNLIKDNVFGNYFTKNNRLIVYIPTNEYWLKVDKTPSEIFANLVDVPNFEISKITDGSLGEFYMMTKK